MFLTILLYYNVLIHFWFLIFEMFLWKSKLAEKSFGMTPQLAQDSLPLAKNQGLYNGFLSAGLLWGIVSGKPEVARSFQLFFVGCMSVAGIYGYLTTKKILIFFMQGLPALITLALLLFA